MHHHCAGLGAGPLNLSIASLLHGTSPESCLSGYLAHAPYDNSREHTDDVWRTLFAPLRRPAGELEEKPVQDAVDLRNAA